MIQLETDHKPLVPILGKKSLDSLPPRVLRLCLHLDRFQNTIHHSPGKSLHLADALLYAPLSNSDENEAEEVEKFVQAVIDTLPAERAQTGTGKRPRVC